MATIKHIFKGESLSILFAFPAEYDMARIQSHGIWIGGTEFAGVIIGQGIELKLTSLQTDLMSGNQRVSLWIDDTHLGVRKPYVGDIAVGNTNALPDNDSTSEVYDVIVNVDISVTSIEAGDLMFNYVQGKSAYQVWLDAGNTGTREDYFAYLQQPAANMIASLNETNEAALTAEGLRTGAESIRLQNEQSRVTAEIIRNENETDRIEAEGLRAGAETSRQTAEGLRVQAENNRQTDTETAISNAENATEDANDAAILANEKAGLANNAALLANEKAGLAATATTQANAARDGANNAAQSATNLVNSYATDLAQKADHGYGANPKTLKQVDDSKAASGGSTKTLKEVDDGIVQLAGDLNGIPERESGYINQLGGESSNTGYNRTPFIPIFSPKDLIVTGYDGGGTGAVLVYFYDINKQPLWAYTTGVAGKKVKHVISKELIETNASNASYVRVTGGISTPADIDFSNIKEIYNDLSDVAKIASTPKTIIPEFGNRWFPLDTVPSWNQKLTYIYDELIGRINIAIDNKPKFVNVTMTEIGKDATNVFPIYKIEIKRIAQDFISGALKKVIIVSGLHGSEYSHPLTTATFIEMLLSDTDDKIITALRDNFHFIIVPSANPWGYSNLIRSNANGVNLNRNFPSGWRAQGTASDFGDYSGISPLSEPESQAINSVIQEHRDFHLAIDGHGYSGFEDNPFLQFWTEAYDNAYQDSFSNTAMFLTRYAMENYPIFQENSKIIGKVDIPVRSALSQNGRLNTYFETQGNGYSTLMELPLRIYGQQSTTGGVEISTLNMMSYINLILDVLR